MIAEPRADDPDLTELTTQVRPELLALYRELDQAVAGYGPVCELSGRCCRFKEYGHVLFLTMPEALLLVADAPPPARDLDGGDSCPWQDGLGRCTARDARPLGCRVFFCDPSFDTHAPELTEQYLTRLKQLVRQHGWPWDYARLHDHLHRARAEGWLNIDLAAGSSLAEEDRGPPAHGLPSANPVSRRPDA
jgi:Fe-S-cluster containining protein